MSGTNVLSDASIKLLKYELSRRGKSLAYLAELYGVSRQRVWDALNTGSPKWEDIVIKHAEVRAKDLTWETKR